MLFPLVDGANLYRVKVISKEDPNVFQTYEITVNRTPDTRPAFADPKVKHNSFRYGYAENLMKCMHGGANNDKTGPGSRMEPSLRCRQTVDYQLQTPHTT